MADLLNAPGYRYGKRGKLKLSYFSTQRSYTGLNMLHISCSIFLGAISNTGTFTALSNYPMTIFKSLVKNMVMNNWLVDSEAKGVEKVDDT